MTGTRLVDGTLGGIEELNDLPPALRDAIYHRLVPPAVGRLLGQSGRIRVVAQPGQSWGRVEARLSPDDRDPVLLVDVAMGPFSVPELAFVQITDPAASRFAVDRDEAGRDTLFGTAGRNLAEEARALAAGLGPGQVRRGLRLLGPLLEAMGAFTRLLGGEVFLVEPLFYHTAWLYERHGLGYLVGREQMETIHAEFQPTGRLHAALDGSSVFRQPRLATTARGRSWALHDGVADGIEDGGWGGVKMYRQADRPADVSTFPDGTY